MNQKYSKIRTRLEPISNKFNENSSYLYKEEKKNEKIIQATHFTKKREKIPENYLSLCVDCERPALGSIEGIYIA